MGRVLALFSDKTSGEVILDDLDNEYLNGLSLNRIAIYDQSVIDSAEKGINAAYNAMNKQKLLKKKSYEISYEFNGNQQAIGLSAGLAFLLAFVSMVEKINFSIAATGEIKNSKPSTKINCINNIDDKIGAAIKELKKGDKIFIPKGNKAEVDDSTIKELKGKEIDLFYIDTNEDAVNALISINRKNDKLISNEANKNLPLSKKILFKILFLTALILFVIFNLDNYNNVNIKKNINYSKDENMISTTKKGETLIKPTVFKNIEKNKSNENLINKNKKSKHNQNRKTDKNLTNITKQPETRKCHPIKIVLYGYPKNLILFFNNSFANTLINYGFCINDKKYNAIIKANIRVIDKEEILSMPFASSSDIILIKQILLENIKMELQNGDQYHFENISNFYKIVKENEEDWSEISKSLIEAILRNKIIDQIQSYYHNSLN